MAASQQHMPLRNGTVVGQVVLPQQCWPRFEQGVALVFNKCERLCASCKAAVDTLTTGGWHCAWQWSTSGAGATANKRLTSSLMTSCTGLQASAVRVIIETVHTTTTRHRALCRRPGDSAGGDSASGVQRRGGGWQPAGDCTTTHRHVQAMPLRYVRGHSYITKCT